MHIYYDNSEPKESKLVHKINAFIIPIIWYGSNVLTKLLSFTYDLPDTLKWQIIILQNWSYTKIHDKSVQFIMKYKMQEKVIKELTMSHVVRNNDSSSLYCTVV